MSVKNSDLLKLGDFAAQNAADDREITEVYCCDLLSIVMGKAPADGAWFTVMGNLNSVAVAALTDVSCIVLCEGVTMDAPGLEKAKQQEISVYTTQLGVFAAAQRVWEELQK